MSRKCVNSADNFCYICGKVTLTNQRCSITQRLETAYFHYFGIKIKNQDKPKNSSTTFTYQIGTNEKLCEGSQQGWTSIQIPAK